MASYSFIVLHFVCLFGKTYLVQATACTDCPVSGLVLHSPWCSTESSRYHSPAMFAAGVSFVHFGCSIGGRIYFDGSSLLLYLFIYY